MELQNHSKLLMCQQTLLANEQNNVALVLDVLLLLIYSHNTVLTEMPLLFSTMYCSEDSFVRRYHKSNQIQSYLSLVLVF